MLSSRFRSLFSGPNVSVSRTIAAYLLAISLPLIDSALTAHFHDLRTIPFSLYYISLAAITILGGTPPALIAIVLCMLSRNYFLGAEIAPGRGLFFWLPGDSLRLATLIVASVTVSLLDLNRRRATRLLAVAHLELQDRTHALAESLHSSKCASWVYHAGSGSLRWFGGSFQVLGRPFEGFDELESLATLFAPEIRSQIPTFLELLRSSSDPIALEHTVTWPDGSIHWLELRATRLAGPYPIWQGVSLDITERKFTESALLRTEKLAAMGRLASTVAHEINNPLESVTNLLYLARSDEHLGSETRNYLAIAEQELARLGDITRLTLGFVRGGAGRANTEIAVVVDEVLSIFRRRLESKNIRVERDFLPGVTIHIAAHELRQILTNLISNSADALHAPGSLIRVCITRDAANAILTVEDNGGGIPDTVLPRIFEPFFTTKEDTGTGIGLWVTHQLVETNAGHISAESGDLGAGIHTRFRLQFASASHSALGSV